MGRKGLRTGERCCAPESALGECRAKPGAVDRAQFELGHVPGPGPERLTVPGAARCGSRLRTERAPRGDAAARLV